METNFVIIHSGLPRSPKNTLLFRNSCTHSEKVIMQVVEFRKVNTGIQKEISSVAKPGDRWYPSDESPRRQCN